MQAAKIAGLDCKGIINEPTAAALAVTNSLNDQDSPLKRYCIFDFGGGTFDVSILEIEGRRVIVKAIAGDTHLGGADIDNAVANHIIEKIRDEYDIDVSKN